MAKKVAVPNGFRNRFLPFVKYVLFASLFISLAASLILALVGTYPHVTIKPVEPKLVDSRFNYAGLVEVLTEEDTKAGRIGHMILVILADFLLLAGLAMATQELGGLYVVGITGAVLTIMIMVLWRPSMLSNVLHCLSTILFFVFGLMLVSEGESPVALMSKRRGKNDKPQIAPRNGTPKQDSEITSAAPDINTISNVVENDNT